MIIAAQFPVDDVALNATRSRSHENLPTPGPLCLHDWVQGQAMNLYNSPEFRRALMVVVNNSPAPTKPKPSPWSFVAGVSAVLGFWIAAWILVISAGLILAKLF